MSYRTAFYYDNRSNLTCVLDPENGLTYYTYDAARRMTSVKNPWGEVTYYEYSPGGQTEKRILGNGCVTYYDYDDIGQTTKVDNRQSDLSVISSFEYERDALGNPLSIVREDGYSTYYEYDAKSQLISELQRDGQGQDVYAWTWDYDAAGNRTVQTFNGVATYYSYNDGNELTEETTGAETTYYDYDGCGNTTVQQAPAGTTYYHWDRENLLSRIDLPGDVHNYFSYDADSKRVTKQDSEGFTRFIYQGPDMLNLLQEQDESETLVAHYTMGNGLEAMWRDSASSFYHFDWLGSTFDLTDVDEAVTDEYLYNGWGLPLGGAGVTVNPHQYVGRQRYFATRETMLYLLGLRFYSVSDGRFISVDPAADDNNWYVYVLGTPTHMSDAAGLSPKCQVVIWIGSLNIYKVDPKTGKDTDQVDPGQTGYWRRRMYSAALSTKHKIERREDYEVIIYSDGRAAELQQGAHLPAIVGIAAVSHGGCGNAGWQGNYGAWNNDNSPQETEVGVFDPMGARSGQVGLMPVPTGDRFILAYFGHCYEYWTRSGKLGKGDIERCHRLYYEQLNLDPAKVVYAIPDSEGAATMAQHERSLRHFWTYFKCCPLTP